MPELKRYSRAGVDVVSINITFDMMDRDHGLLVGKYFSDWISALEYAQYRSKREQTMSPAVVSFFVEVRPFHDLFKRARATYSRHSRT